MTRKEIETEIAVIQYWVHQGDYEQAHALEDALYHRAMRYLAEAEGSGLAPLAELVLSTEDLKFPRRFG